MYECKRGGVCVWVRERERATVSMRERIRVLERKRESMRERKRVYERERESMR